MRSAQFTFREFAGMFRRRKKMFILPALLIAALAGTGAFMLPSKFESSTTILMQREEVVNPLISYAEAMTMATEDRLQTFNEIIYSRTTIQRLIDSLGIGSKAKSEDQRQGLVDAISHNIATERRGGDSFRITYVDTDPVRAQKAAAVLSNLFISTLISVKGMKNEFTVQFFEKKLEDIRQKFEESQKEVVSILGQRLSTMPTESRMAYSQVEDVERQIASLDAKIKNYQQQLDVLKTFPYAIHTEDGKQSLFDLQRQDIPFASDLRVLVSKYDDDLHRYTPQYPEVGRLESQILDLLQRMRNAVEQEIDNDRPVLMDLEKKRSDLLDNIKQASLSEKANEDKESDYGIYQKMYDEMKVKLEQAKTERDLESKGANQFVVLDPPLVPSHPTKPNRMMIMIGGLFLGVFVGFLSAIFKEMLDTTIRAPRDIEVFQKPVIAFITDGNEESFN
ncbi:MAG TPA: GNVR domain-containing protein [Bacteroidota bacterium]|nr:GNVR domain-containing protein [Bacteroidota bacterium]